MSSSLVPGCAAMKYGTRYCFLPASALNLSNSCLKRVVVGYARLHHLRERPLLGVLGGDLQISADMVLHQFLHVLRRLDREVVAQARPDQHFLDALQRTRAPVDLDERSMVGREVLADAGKHAARLAACRLDRGTAAAETVHVGGRSAEVGNDAGESGHLVADLLDLADDRVFAAALDDAALVLGDRTEGAAAEAAAHDVHREADHFPGGNLRCAVMAAVFVGVCGVRAARIRQAEHMVHLRGGERNRRRIEPHVAIAMRLHQCARVARVGLEVQHAIGVCIEHRIALHLLVRRQPDDGAVARRGLELHPRIRHELHWRCAVIAGLTRNPCGAGTRAIGCRIKSGMTSAPLPSRTSSPAPPPAPKSSGTDSRDRPHAPADRRWSSRSRTSLADCGAG